MQLQGRSGIKRSIMPTEMTITDGFHDDIEKADAKGDLKAVCRGVRSLSGVKNYFSLTHSPQPTKMDND